MAKKDEEQQPTTADQHRVLNEYERVEMEFKQEQILEMRARRQEREQRNESLKQRRARVLRDVAATEKKRAEIKARCRHKKGGKNNNFARGNSPDHSVVTNTFPNGDVSIVCTRCGDDAWRPRPALKKTDPAAYKVMLAKWEKWSQMETDNEPSGSQIFLISAA